MGTAPHVRRAARDDIPRLAAVLARAFAADPFFSWLAGTAPERSQRVRDGWTAILRFASAGLSACWTTDDHAGVAVWIPPGRPASGIVDQLRMLPALAELTGWGRLRQASAALEWLERRRRALAPTPHWYLSALGVEPERQGEGIGSALLAPGLEEADAAGLVCYLETAVGRNVLLYERHGFDVVEEVVIPNTDVHGWLMLRPATSEATAGELPVAGRRLPQSGRSLHRYAAAMHATRRPLLLPLALLLAACSSAPAAPGSSPSPRSAGISATPSTTAAPSSSDEAPLPGGQLAFLRDGELVTLDMSRGTETSTGILNVLPLAFSRDFTALIGIRPIPDDPYNVILVRQPVDGSEAVVLIEKLPNPGVPAASADGRYLAFGSDGAAPNGLVVVDLESGEASQLTADGGNSPVWSPDGRSIAYTRSGGTEGHDLFIVDVQTAATRQLTADEWEDSPLRWTEDGTAVLTTSHRGGDGTRLAITVWQVDATDGALTERSDLEFAVTAFALPSPDGRYVARLSPQNILSLTEGELRVGNRLGSADPSVHLTWAPNSAWLVWTSWDADGAAHDLYMVHAPDGDPVQLTRTPEGESHPVWGPARHGF